MGGLIEIYDMIMNIFTDGWTVFNESDHFASFSELSDEEKRIQHLIDERSLPYRQMYRIYQKDKNIVVANQELEWKFIKNRFFIKRSFNTFATITPTRVYSSNIDVAAHFVCKHLGFNPEIHINKVLLRQIIKKGKPAYDEYVIKHSEEIRCHKIGFKWNELVTYTDDPKLFLEKFEQDWHRFYELRDLLYQAKQLNRIIKMSWSPRRIHDEHMKWTEEIHQLKTRNCSEEPIWEKNIKLPKGVTLLNSERAIADEGSSMHHCIYTNYCRLLKDRRMVAFHVVNEDGDFTCSFIIKDNKVLFDQAYKAWNKTLTVSEMEIAKSLESYVEKLLILNPIKQKHYLEDLDLF